MAGQLTPEDIEQVTLRATRLYSSEEVEAAVDAVAARMTHDLAGQNPLLLCVVVGGVVPAGMLLTRLHFPLQIDYVHATRYKNGIVGQELEWIATPRIPLTDRVVVIIDDVLDGGITLTGIIKYCEDKKAKKVLTMALVDKETSRQAGGLARADYTGLKAPDHYLFGFGMDYKTYLRNAPGIFAADEQDAS